MPYDEDDDEDTMLETPAPDFAPSDIKLGSFTNGWTFAWLLRMPWSNLTRLTILSAEHAPIPSSSGYQMRSGLICASQIFGVLRIRRVAHRLCDTVYVDECSQLSGR